jgi:hypothetical protein
MLLKDIKTGVIKISSNLAESDGFGIEDAAANVEHVFPTDDDLKLGTKKWLDQVAIPEVQIEN